MRFLNLFNQIFLYLLQTNLNPQEELDPIEVYRFLLILFGIIVLILILVYIVLTSKQE